MERSTMDDTLRDPAAGRDAASHDAGNHSPAPRDRAFAGPIPPALLTTEELRNTLAALDKVKEPERYAFLSGLLAKRLGGNPETRPATQLPDTGPDAEPVVVCAWCPSLHILKLQRREQDVVIVYWQGKELRIIRNGVNL